MVPSEVNPGVVSVVASRLDPEVGAVVVLLLATVGTPVGVHLFVLVAATKTVTSPKIVVLSPFSVVGNFLSSNRGHIISCFAVVLGKY